METSIDRASTIDGLCIVPKTAKSGLRNALSRAVKRGEMRRLAPRIYLRAEAAVEQVVRRHIFSIVAALYEGAVISHRSAIETGLDPSDRHIVITHPKIGARRIAGVTIHALAGPPAQAEDMPFVDGLFVSSPQRSWLECLQKRRRVGAFRKTFSRTELEQQIGRWLSRHGEQQFKQRIDALHALAGRLGWHKEAARFQELAGALLGTRPPTELSAPAAQARGAGRAYDGDRDELFAILVRKLRDIAPGIARARGMTRDEWACACFFEAYFSNYIEGTEFTIDEAQEIVFAQRVPDNRAEGHDILGTYQVIFPWAIAANRIEPLTSYEMFLQEIERVHATIMVAHPQARPGAFKTKENRVGMVQFVKPELVTGTLRRGLEYLGVLDHALSRALFIKFLISEVHPFADGNGRVSRAMLNRELHAGGQWPIMIPTAYRIDYRAALRKLSLGRDADAYVRVMTRAQHIAPALDYTSLAAARADLESYRAFDDDESATFDWRKLRSA